MTVGCVPQSKVTVFGHTPFHEPSLFPAWTRLRRKAVEGYRSPRRFATAGVVEYSARSWSAPVLWRFGCDAEWTTDVKPTEVYGPNARPFGLEANLNLALDPNGRRRLGLRLGLRLGGCG